MKEHGFRSHYQIDVAKDMSLYLITHRKSKKNEERKPRTDPQGTLTFKDLAGEENPAKKEQAEQNEVSGDLGGARRLSRKQSLLLS